LVINRRKFLTLVRNRVAAGVLCSGMLTDALQKVSITSGTHYYTIIADDISNSVFTATEALAMMRKVNFWHSQYMNEPAEYYGVGILEQTIKFQEEVKNAHQTNT